jgi:hypothetical protein
MSNAELGLGFESEKGHFGVGFSLPENLFVPPNVQYRREDGVEIGREVSFRDELVINPSWRDQYVDRFSPNPNSESILDRVDVGDKASTVLKDAVSEKDSSSNGKGYSDYSSNDEVFYNNDGTKRVSKKVPNKVRKTEVSIEVKEVREKERKRGDYEEKERRKTVSKSLFDVLQKDGYNKPSKKKVS